MNLEAYEAAAEKQREANTLAREALAPYWDSIVEIANADDMAEALNTHALCIEDNGELTLAIGGPGVWFLPSGVMAGAWWGPRVYCEPITREHEEAADAVLEYLAEMKAEGIL